MMDNQDLVSCQAIMDGKRIDILIKHLSNIRTRNYAMIELNSKQEIIPNLGEKLWCTNSVKYLLEEIENARPALNTQKLTRLQSKKIRNAVALLQCVANDSKTKEEFLQVFILE